MSPFFFSDLVWMWNACVFLLPQCKLLAPTTTSIHLCYPQDLGTALRLLWENCPHCLWPTSGAFPSQTNQLADWSYFPQPLVAVASSPHGCTQITGTTLASLHATYATLAFLLADSLLRMLWNQCQHLFCSHNLHNHQRTTWQTPSICSFRASDGSNWQWQPRVSRCLNYTLPSTSYPEKKAQNHRHDLLEDFTLSHRFHVDSRWTFDLFFLGVSPANSLSRIHVESTWSPPGVHLSIWTPPQNTGKYEFSKPDSIWTPHGLITFYCIISFSINNKKSAQAWIEHST